MGKQRHLSRLAAPKTWPVLRKNLKWIAKPMPGTHNQKHSLPLVVVLRELLKITQTASEVKKLLNDGEILINQEKIKDARFPLGLLDTLSIPKISQHYRMSISKLGKLIMLPIDEKEAKIVPLKVRTRTAIKGKKIQINFTNGWNKLLEKDSIMPHEVLLYDAGQKKTAEHLKFEPGNVVFVLGGKHIGEVAKIDSVKLHGELKKSYLIRLKSDDTTWESDKEDLILIGKQKPEVKVQ